MAFPLKPPADWFAEPEPDQPTPLTVTADGQVYGHLALWDQCHTGFTDCIRPPRSPDGYRTFHVGALETLEGSQIPVGKIMYDGKHAPLDLVVAAATRHYDDNAKVGAYVRATDGRHGIWLTGAARHDIPEAGLRDLRANPPSGDWRLYGQQLTLVAALAVPVPGYPVTRNQIALAAAGDLPATLILDGYSEDETEPAVRDRAYLRQRARIQTSLSERGHR